MDDSERRTAERFKVNLQGTATFEVEGAEETTSVTVTQISAFSVYFESEFCPDITDSVRLDLQMDESESPFQAVGTVIRVDPSGDGYSCTLKFEEPPNF